MKLWRHSCYICQSVVLSVLVCHIFDGQPLEVLKTLRTLLPDAPSCQGLALLYHQSLLLSFLCTQCMSVSI